MRLKSIHIQNYRSLQDVWLLPSDLSLLVGANASGKSNFADCIAFLADMYRDGLEIAVQRAGGYESIAFRKLRRTKLPITIEVEAEIEGINIPARLRRLAEENEAPSLVIRHAFSLKAQTESISADYDIVSEEIRVSTLRNGFPHPTLVVHRIQGRSKVTYFDKTLAAIFSNEPESQVDPRSLPPETQYLQWYFAGLAEAESLEDPEFRLLTTDLMITWLALFASAFRAFSRSMAAMQVHQINVSAARSNAAPAPNAELGRYGLNLPATINFLRQRFPPVWRSIIALMQRVLPNLSDIQVRNTQDRTLGLVFFEEGFRRPWGVKEVSDGTVQMLAMLVAILDPRGTLDVIEEPENSVHPWLVRVVLEACREASKQKQIIITSHSPVLLDEFSPDDVFVIWRREGASKIAPLRSLDDHINGKWRDGKIRLYKYLDSGIVPEAVPAAPEISLFSITDE